MLNCVAGLASMATLASAFDIPKAKDEAFHGKTEENPNATGFTQYNCQPKTSNPYRVE